MRLKSKIWVMAYIRRLAGELIPAAVVRRGDGDAGAVYIKINTLDGQARILGPALAGFADRDGARLWSFAPGSAALAEADADRYLSRQAQFDPDIWVVEIEDREGRHFLDDCLVDV